MIHIAVPIFSGRKGLPRAYRCHRIPLPYSVRKYGCQNNWRTLARPEICVDYVNLMSCCSAVDSQRLIGDWNATKAENDGHEDFHKYSVGRDPETTDIIVRGRRIHRF